MQNLFQAIISFRPSGRKWLWLSGLIALLPILTAFMFMLNHRVNTVIADDWCGVGEVVDSAIEGGLTASELFAQHNIHRPFTLYAFTALSYYLTDWNRQIDIGFSFLLMLSIFALLVFTVRQVLPSATDLAIVIAALLLFSMRGRDFWIWAGLWSYLLSWLPVLVAVWVVQRMKVGGVGWILALVMTILATYSLASGWIAWFIMPLLLWSKGYRNWTHYAFWFGCFVITGFTYFTHFQITSQQLQTSCDSWVAGEGGLTLPVRLLTGTQLFFGHLTAPFLPGGLDDISLARIPGGVLLIFIAVNMLWWRRLWQRHGQWSAMMPLIVIMLYALGSAAMTIYGRLRSIAVFNSGYQLHIAIFWIVFLVLVMTFSVEQLRQPQRRKRIWASLNMSIVAALAGMYLYANNQAANLTLYPAEAQPYTHGGEARETCFASVPFDGVECLFSTQIEPQSPPETILAMSQRFAEARVNVFGEVTAMLPAEYISATPVIVAAAPAYQHPILGYQTPDGAMMQIPERDVYHLTDAARSSWVSQHAALGHMLNEDLEGLGNILALTGETWLLAMDDAVGQSVRAQLEAEGYELSERAGTWWRRQFDWVLQIRAGA